MTELSIVILNYRNSPLLRLFLTSLARVLPTDIDTQVIVVDSASSAETRNIVLHEGKKLFQNIDLIPFTSNTGYTKGVNAGLRKSTGRYILNMNPDIVPLEGSLHALVAHMKSNPHIGILGPQLLNLDGSRQETCFRFMGPYTLMCRRLPFMPHAREIVRKFIMSDTDFSQPQEVDWLMGSAMMIDRKALERVGFLDEGLFHYMSDVDWPLRFWYHGYAVSYCPSARMYHYHQRQSKGRLGLFDVLFRKQGRWHLRDAWRYFRKHGIRVHRPLVA